MLREACFRAEGRVPISRLRAWNSAALCEAEIPRDHWTRRLCSDLSSVVSVHETMREVAKYIGKKLDSGEVAC